jgi:hypothetical protein
MPNHAVADNEVDTRGERKRLVFEGTAIQHKSAAGFAETRYELIHDAAARADIIMLRPLAKFDQLQARNIYSREAR